MNIENIHNVYFIGIGGIGMSALARYFNLKGIQVSGYDKTPSEITKNLEDQGININYVDDIGSIDQQFKEQDDNDRLVIIYTPAIPTE